MQRENIELVLMVNLIRQLDLKVQHVRDWSGTIEIYDQFTALADQNYAADSKMFLKRQ